METPVTSPDKHFKTWLLTEIVDYRRRSQLEPEVTLQLARRDTAWMREQIDFYRGEVTGLSGDCNAGLMASFDDNENAFHCAVALQEGMIEALGNAAHPGQVLAHRFGLHFGEVHFVGGVQVGDCITMAKGLRERAEPNEIVLSHPTVVMLGATPARQPIFEGEKELPMVPEPVKVYRLPPPLVVMAEPESEATQADVEEEVDLAAMAGITTNPNATVAARRVAALRDSMEDGVPSDYIPSPEAIALEVKPKKKANTPSATVAGTAKFQRQREGRITATGSYPVVFLAVQKAAETFKAQSKKSQFEKGVMNLVQTGWLRRAYLELLFYQSGDAIVVDATGRRENKHHADTIEKLFDVLCQEDTPITFADLKEAGYDARVNAPEHKPAIRPSPFGKK